MAQYGGTPMNGGSGSFIQTSINGGNGRRNPTFQKTKSVSYHETISDQIFAISADPAATPKEQMPRAVEVVNTGGTPIFLMVGYKSYSTDIVDGDTDYLHVLLQPGEIFNPPVHAVISDNADKTIMFGTKVDNLAPDPNEYTDSTAKTTEGFADDNDTTITFDDASGGSAGNMFRVNDLVRFDDEVCRVVSLTDTVFTVERAVHGTAKADHTNNTAIRFPFFNAYHDFDRYTVAQTDSNGRFRCLNFFGQGRTATANQGIIPGSFAVKFYDPGYHNCGMSGISSSTKSGLTAGGSYWLKIAIDGGTAESINFEVDTSNTNFGGSSGIISKIQEQLDAKFYNTAANIFEQRATVGIVGGDIRFTSGSRLSTSAIALTAGADGASAAYNIFAQQNGRFPAIGTSAGNPRVPDAIAAKLPDDVIYNAVTYATSPNSGAFGYDDGNSNLFGACGGRINYETGAINMTGCPANAEFVVSALTNSAFSGKLNEAEPDRINSMVEILANTPNQKWNGSVRVSTWNAYSRGRGYEWT